MNKIVQNVLSSFPKIFLGYDNNRKRENFKESYLVDTYLKYVEVAGVSYSVIMLFISIKKLLKGDNTPRPENNYRQNNNDNKRKNKN